MVVAWPSKIVSTAPWQTRFFRPMRLKRGNKVRIVVYFIKQIVREKFLKYFRVDPVHFNGVIPKILNFKNLRVL